MTTIADGLSALASRSWNCGAVVEVALLKTAKATVRGYFDNPSSVLAALEGLDAAALRPEGCYVTLNAVRPDLLARAANRFDPYAKTRVADQDITRRLWLPIDCDPVRPAGISATDTEYAAALARRDAVVAWLTTARGWPAPLLGTGGNSGHAVYAIDLPADDETTTVIKAVLDALAARFDNGTVTVDTSVFNAGRIWTLYGTMKRKGDSLPDRPHRRSAVATIPDLVLVTREQLAAVAALVPTTPVHTPPPAPGPVLDMAAEFHQRGWHLKALGDGKHAVTCPWSSAHSGVSGITETVLFAPSGPGEYWGFKCQHAHCADRTISDVWLLVRPPLPPDPVIIDDLLQTHRVAYAKAPIESGIGACVLRPLLDRPYSGWFARGAVHLIAGSSGAGKTTLVLDLLQTQYRGGPYLGHTGAAFDYLVLFADRGHVSNTETLQRMRLDPQTVPLAHLPPTTDGASALQAIITVIDQQPDLPAVVFVEGADLLVEDASKTHVVTPFVVGLRHVAERYALAIVLSVGAPKARPNEQYALKRDQVFGSQAWSRLSDTVLVLSITGDGTAATRDLVVLHRNAAAETFHLQFEDGRLVEAENRRLTEPNMLEWMRDQETFRAWTFRQAFALSGATAATILDGFMAAGTLKAKTRGDRTLYVYQRDLPREKTGLSNFRPDRNEGVADEAEKIRTTDWTGQPNGDMTIENTQCFESSSRVSLVPPNSCPIVQFPERTHGELDNRTGFQGYTRARADDGANDPVSEARPGRCVQCDRALTHPRAGERCRRCANRDRAQRSHLPTPEQIA